MDVIVGVATSQAAALVDLDATYLVQMALFLVLYFLLTVVFFRPYTKRLRQRDDAGHGLRRQSKEALQRARDLDEDAERRLGDARQAAVAERRRLAEEGVALRDTIVAKERERAQARVDAELAALGTEKDRFLAGSDRVADDLAILIEQQMQSVEAR